MVFPLSLKQKEGLMLTREPFHSTQYFLLAWALCLPVWNPNGG